MKTILNFKTLKVCVAVLAMLLLIISSDRAATITAQASTAWELTSTWTGGVVPTSHDSVVIPSGFSISVNSQTDSCRAITFLSTATNTTFTINSGYALTVSGALTMLAQSTTSGITKQITVSGTLNAGSITINGSNISGQYKSILLVSSGGVVNCNGNFNFANSTSSNAGTAGLTWTDNTSIVNITGNISCSVSGCGKLNLAGTFSPLNLGGNYNFSGNMSATNSLQLTLNGTGAQTISGTCSFKNIIVSKSSGTVTAAAVITITGSSSVGLSIIQGTLDLSTYQLVTSGSNNLNLSSGSTLEIGGTANLPAFSNTSINSTSTVIYYGSSQTITSLTYGNLTLSGSGTKTIGTAASGTLAAGILNISGTAIASVTNTNVSVGELQFNNVIQAEGTWGYNASSPPTNGNTTYFANTSGYLNVQTGPLDHFAISAISSPQNAGTAITGITITAQDASNNTVIGFTGTVTYGGTAGITGTSASFTAGVLSGVSVTPTLAGNNVTFTVTNSSYTGSSTFNVNVHPTAYISNYGSNTVSVINVATNNVIATIPVGREPNGVSVNTNGNKVYITNEEDNTVSVINTATNTVLATVTGFDNPVGLSVSPDGSKVYVANYNANTISIIDTSSNSISATITGLNTPISLCVSPDGSKVYVGNTDYESGNTVSVINTSNNTISATITVGTDPVALCISPDGSKVYVTNYFSNSVSVINTSDNTISATITVGTDPCSLSVSPDGSKVYVANNGSASVSVISTSNNTVTNTITVGSNPQGVSVSPDGSKVYVANSGGGTVSVINTSGNTVSATITVGSNPYGFGNFITSYSEPPVINVFASANPVCTGTSVTLTASGAATYSWSGSLGTSNPLTVSPTTTTTYTVTGTSAGGTGTASITVTVSILWTGSNGPDWSDYLNWCGNTVPTSSDNVAIPSGTTYSPTVDISTPAKCNNLTIESGATLTIGAGDALTVSGTTTLNGTKCLVIESNATSEGSFIDNGTITDNSAGGTGADIQRYVNDHYTGSSERWEYVSSPIAAAPVNIFATTGGYVHDLYYADETTNSWVGIPYGGSPADMTVMQGYCRDYVQAEGDGEAVKDFIGTPNTGTLTPITVTRTENAPGGLHGYNLVGNPYPSAIDWNALYQTTSGINAAVYFRSNGNYGTYIPADTISGSNSSFSTNGATDYIPPMQSFWIRVSYTGSNVSTTLPFTNSVRVHNAQNIYKPKGSSPNNALHITATNNTNGLTDDAWVVFNTNATNGFDNKYDAYKMFASDTAYPQVYSQDSSLDNLSINNLSALIGARNVQLGFNTSNSGQFTFTASGVSSFTGNGNTVYLEDLLTGAYQDLSVNNTYQFTSGATSGLNRFLLVFNPLVTGITEHANSNIQIYAFGNQIHINSNNTLSGDVSVYDMLGQVVTSKHLTGTTSDVISMEAANAVYIVKYISSGQTLTKRVLINQ